MEAIFNRGKLVTGAFELFTWRTSKRGSGRGRLPEIIVLLLFDNIDLCNHRFLHSPAPRADSAVIVTALHLASTHGVPFLEHGVTSREKVRQSEGNFIAARIMRCNVASTPE